MCLSLAGCKHPLPPVLCFTGVVLWELVTGEVPRRGGMREIRWARSARTVSRGSLCRTSTREPPAAAAWCSAWPGQAPAAQQPSLLPFPTPPYTPGRVPEECSQEVAALIDRCLALVPSQRPSAKEVYLAIKASPAAGTVGQQAQQAAAGQAPR